MEVTSEGDCGCRYTVLLCRYTPRKATVTTYFRAPGSRTEHITRDGTTTLCGISARYGARFTDADRGPDAKIRPLCHNCRKGA
jgi:hypothetical protein